MRGNNTDIITGSSSNMLGKEDVIRPFQIEEVMQERKQLLEKVINRCRYELKGMPEGTLYACPRQNGNSYRYYLKHESSGQSYFGKSSTGESHTGKPNTGRIKLRRYAPWLIYPRATLWFM